MNLGLLRKNPASGYACGGGGGEGREERGGIGSLDCNFHLLGHAASCTLKGVQNSLTKYSASLHDNCDTITLIIIKINIGQSGSSTQT